MEVYTKLHEVQKRVKSVEKNGYNSFNKYEYATYADVLDAVRPHLDELGLVLTVSVEPVNNEFIFSEDGKYYTISSCVATAELVALVDGSRVTVKSPGMSADKQGDKSCFKAVTGAKKYAVLGLFNLDTDGADPENDAVTVERTESAPSRTRPSSASSSRTSQTRPTRSNDDF